ncbi:MAG: DUF1232 domain-containing protein [Cytophagales bacterium]|nr:DUF1232 domain-containing protein [Cytophagales bacterium]
MKKVIKDIIAVILGIIASIVIIAPSALPDVIPLVGAMDEVAAGYTLLACLKHFGIDLTGFISPTKKPPIDKQ